MLRRGMDEAPRPEPEHPLFGPQAKAQLRAIEISDLWQGLRSGIEAQREALLSTPLGPGERLRERWGAIQQLSLLLHGGPQMILQARQLAEATQPAEPPEREYSPNVHSFEGR